MTSENGEGISTTTRAEIFDEAHMSLETAYEAVQASFETYDSTLARYALTAREILTGATIVVWSGQTQQELKGKDWEQTALQPIDSGAEMVVDEVVVYHRNSYHMPSLNMHIWAKATERQNDGTDRRVAFWLHNAVWEFKPETPVE